jgi:hypothetical protein
VAAFADFFRPIDKLKSRKGEIIDSGARFLYFAIQSEGGMQDLNRALDEISSIRRQMARSTEFRGYGPATLAATGLFALGAAMMQALWVTDAASHIAAYLTVWVVTAVVSASWIGVQMYTRTKRMHSGMADEMIRMAVEQFLPSAGAGILLTAVLVLRAPGSLWMLPGLWQMIFSLGVFSSCRFLPRMMATAGGWYLLSGLLCLSLGDARALSPWAMGISYGVGQMLVATVLLLSKEETNHEG